MAFLPATATELRLFGYSAGNFGKNLIWSAADITLLFVLTDLVGLAPAAAGSLMMIATLGDLAFDVVAGAMITRLRIGGVSYRAVLLLGSIPCGTAFAALYALPWLGGDQFGWLALSLLVFRCSYAIIDVPHNAMLATMTQDSRARGRTSGYRSFFSAISSLIVATILTPLVNRAGAQGARGALALVGLSAGILFCLSMIVVLLATTGPSRPAGPCGANRKRASRALFPKPDRLMAAMTVIAVLTGLAIPMFGRTMLYFADYVLGNRAFAGDALTALTIGQFPGVMVWTFLVRRHDKTVLLIAGHAVAVCGTLLFALSVPHVPAMLACAALIGVGQAGAFMLPWAILADVVDFAEYRHGERRETATFATFLVVIKASGAGSIAFIGWTMGWLGYAPGIAQSRMVRDGIFLLGIGIPVLGGLAAILLSSRLSIGHRRHALIRRRLDTRTARQMR